MSNEIDLRAWQQELRRQEQFPAGRGQLEATADSEGTKNLHIADPTAYRIQIDGRIVDATAYVHNYKVQLDRGIGTLRGILLSHTSNAVFGAKQGSTLPVGTRVLCSWLPGDAECLIIGTIPEETVEASASLSDTLVPGGNVGFHVDPYLQGAFLLPIAIDDDLDACGATDCSAGRPTDSLAGGEWNITSETGMAFHQDPFLTFMRVDDETGVWGFYPDSLLRIGGHNLEVHSAGYERTDYNDRTRLSQEEGWAPRLHESQGSPVEGTTLHRNPTTEEVQQTSPWYWYDEPLHDDQQPFWRLRRFQGWLAGGLEEHLQYWPTDQEAIQRYSEDLIASGLYDRHVFANGRAVTRSVKGQAWIKTPRIVSPKRRRPPAEDQQAPEEFTSVVGELSPYVSTPTGEHHEVRVTAFIDQLNYICNYEGLQPFFDQDASWYVPEESEGIMADEFVSDATPLFALLASQQNLPAPTPYDADTDERYTRNKVWPNMSSIQLLDDGGIVLTDGWGSQIVMTGGNIRFSAAADILVDSGRNTNILAGRDTILRARHGVDMSAGTNDVRIKAERNVMVLGGNDLHGGVLIESRAPATCFKPDQIGEDLVYTGVLIKAPDSNVHLMTKQLVLASRDLQFTAPCDDGATTPRQILLDAGTGRIVCRAKAFERHLSTDGYFLDSIKVDTDSYTTNEYRADRIHLGTHVSVDGNLINTGCIMTVGWVMSRDGHFASDYTDGVGKVINLLEAEVDDLDTQIGTIATRVTELETWLATHADQAFASVDLTDPCAIAFAFRPYTQLGYGATYHVWESRWRQIARQTGQSLPVWVESSVLSNYDGPTMPWPGYDAWSDTAVGQYRTMDSRLYDEDSGFALDRDSPYWAAGAFPAPGVLRIDAGLTVVSAD